MSVEVHLNTKRVKPWAIHSCSDQTSLMDLLKNVYGNVDSYLVSAYVGANQRSVHQQIIGLDTISVGDIVEGYGRYISYHLNEDEGDMTTSCTGQSNASISVSDHGDSCLASTSCSGARDEASKTRKDECLPSSSPCLPSSSQCSPIPKGGTSTSQIKTARVKNAFDLMMNKPVVLPTKFEIQRKNNKMELFNEFVDFLESMKLGFHHAIADTRGRHLVKTVTDALWYVDPHLATIEQRACHLPDEFRDFTGKNNPGIFGAQKFTKIMEKYFHIFLQCVEK